MLQILGLKNLRKMNKKAFKYWDANKLERGEKLMKNDSNTGMKMSWGGDSYGKPQRRKENRRVLREMG